MLACQAAVNMLAQRRKDKQDIDYIFLYTEPTAEMQRLLAQGNEDDVQFEMIRMQTANGEDGGLCVGEPEPQPTSWLSSLKQFFIDKWSGIGTSTSTKVAVGPSRDKKQIHGCHMIAS